MTPSILAFFLALPGTQPLTVTGDPSMQMIDGIHTYLKRAINASVPNRKPTRERLRYIIGAVDRRLEFDNIEILDTTPGGSAYDVHHVRWPVLDGVHGEGLLYRPKAAPRSAVICLPDAAQTPEELAAPAALASAGAEVLVPMLIDRKDTWSGNPAIRMTNQPHREFLYRMAFPVGRHIIG
jgi:hypothetical protein